MIEFKDKNFKSKFKNECIEAINNSDFKNQILENINLKEVYEYQNELNFEGYDSDEKDKKIDEIVDENNKDNKNKLISKRQLSDIEPIKEKNDYKDKEKSIYKIKDYMINYNFEYSDLDKKIKWPKNVLFGSKKFYVMNKSKDFVDDNKVYLNCYCVKHHYKSKILKNEKKCNAKIQYNKKTEEFFLIADYSSECQLKRVVKIKEEKENSNKYYKLTNLRNELMNYLNQNPLIKFNSFKKYAEDKLIKTNLNVFSNDNFYKNIYYPWKKNNMAFKWYSIFENNKTKLNKIFLRDVYYTYILYSPINLNIILFYIFKNLSFIKISQYWLIIKKFIIII